MVDNIQERGEPPIMIEAACCMRPESLKRRGAIHKIRSAIGLEGINPNLCWSMQIPTGLSEEWGHMAGCTFSFTIEERLSACSRRRVKVVGWRHWSQQRKLVRVQGWQLGRDQVCGTLNISKPIRRRHRELGGVI